MAEIPKTIVHPLLYLSRLRLDSMEIVKARQLCADVPDWLLFTDIAQRKFSLPIIFRHLKMLDLGNSRSSEMAVLRVHSRQMAMAALKVSAAQEKFHSTCVEPLKLRHAYVKGPALAVQYYGDPGLRFSRDIDILIAKNDFSKAIRRASQEGYRVFSGDGFQLTSPSDRDIRALLRYYPITTLLSPDNVPIEVHTELSKTTAIFDPELLLREATEMQFGNAPIKTLPTNLLFVYICYHNTRHTWSHLHWLADLDAMMQHPSFDETVALQWASRFGLREIVEACIEFRALAFGSEYWEGTSVSGHGAQLLNLCIQNLAGDLDLERKLRKQQGVIDLPVDWMVHENVLRRVRKHGFLAKILPDFEHYRAWPLPDRLQWLYSVVKLGGSLKRHLTSLVGRG